MLTLVGVLAGLVVGAVATAAWLRTSSTSRVLACAIISDAGVWL